MPDDLKPQLCPGLFVFCSVTAQVADRLDAVPVCRFREEEGITLIIEQAEADRYGLSYEGIWVMITLTALTALNDVGILARVSKILAEAGVPVNAVSAYYHDHLFVPSDKAEDAIRVLLEEI